jgi:hypothetical protein
MSEQNKAVVRRLVDEVMNAGRLEVLDELYAPRLAAAAKAWIAPFRVSFPDVSMQVVDLVAEGDKVVGRSCARAPNTAIGRVARLPAVTSSGSPRSTSSNCWTVESSGFGVLRTLSRGQQLGYG